MVQYPFLGDVGEARKRKNPYFPQGDKLIESRKNNFRDESVLGDNLIHPFTFTDGLTETENTDVKGSKDGRSF